MEYKLQPLIIPSGSKIVKNEFTIYDPETDFTEDRNMYNLTEDLLQIEFDFANLIIDLGWYGEVSTNNGEFKILVIKNKNWEKPVRVTKSKSQKIITKHLEGFLLEILESGIIKPVHNSSYPKVAK